MCFHHCVHALLNFPLGLRPKPNKVSQALLETVKAFEYGGSSLHGRRETTSYGAERPGLVSPTGSENYIY